MVFRIQNQTAAQLAKAAAQHLCGNPVVCAIPGASVELGCDLAVELGAPVEVISVRSICARRFPWEVIGAVTDDGVTASEPLHDWNIDDPIVRRLIQSEAAQAAEERNAHLGFFGHVPVMGHSVLLADQGSSSVGCLTAVIQSLRQRGAAKVVLAAPTLDCEALARLECVADHVIVLTESTTDPIRDDVPFHLDRIMGAASPADAPLWGTA